MPPDTPGDVGTVPPDTPTDASTVILKLADAPCLLRRWMRMPNAEIRAKLAGKARSVLRGEEDLLILRKRLDAAAPGEPGSLAVEPVEPRHLAQLHELNIKRCARRKTPRFVEDLARGYRCFVAYRGDVLVGYYWWTDQQSADGHRDFERLQLGLELGTDAVYGFDFFVLDEHRGSGTASDFLDGVERALRELGYRDLWGYVVASNRPARWLYAIRGYEQTERLTRKTVLGRSRLVARTRLA